MLPKVAVVKLLRPIKTMLAKNKTGSPALMTQYICCPILLTSIDSKSGTIFWMTDQSKKKNKLINTATENKAPMRIDGYWFLQLADGQK